MSAKKLQHFLLVFDHRTVSVTVEEFGADGKSAVEAYEACERTHRGDLDVEIVLIGSDSLDTVRITHANYFEAPATVSKYFADLPQADRQHHGASAVPQ